MRNQIVTVEFHGQQILALKNGEDIRVSVASICNNIGLQVEAQRKRIHRHPVLSQGESMMDFPSDGGQQIMMTLPLDMIPGWLMGVDTHRVKPELRPKLVEYQRECFKVLWQYFSQGEAVNPAFRPEQTRKALPNGLSIEQQDAIKQLVKARAETYPQDKRGVATIKFWSALKSKFGVSYKEIPGEHFTDALSLVARLEPLEGELLEAEKPAALPAPGKTMKPPFVTKTEGSHTGAIRNLSTVRKLITELQMWGYDELPRDVANAFHECLYELNALLITGWTEVDEALQCLHRAQRYLSRWQGSPL